MLFKIAFRNILRNRRRSLMTGSAVAVGAMAMLVFGGYITYIFSAFETGLVQRIGHLTVFRSGYFVFGAGNPSAYGIDDYQRVMRTLANDPVLKPMVRVITPTQSLLGIAGNFSGGNNAAKTFLGSRRDSIESRAHAAMERIRCRGNRSCRTPAWPTTHRSAV